MARTLHKEDDVRLDGIESIHDLEVQGGHAWRAVRILPPANTPLLAEDHPSDVPTKTKVGAGRQPTRHEGFRGQV